MRFRFSEYQDSSLGYVRELWVISNEDGNGVCLQVQGDTALSIYRVEDSKAEKLFVLKPWRHSLDQTQKPMEQLPNNTDLNKIDAPGVYVCPSTSINSPLNSWGVLVVFNPYTSRSANTTQLWLGSDTKSRWRSGDNMSWGKWV